MSRVTTYHFITLMNPVLLEFVVKWYKNLCHFSICLVFPSLEAKGRHEYAKRKPQGFLRITRKVLRETDPQLLRKALKMN